jgi:hypothetical protein
MQQSRTPLETALAAHAAGICVIPPHEDGSKAPLVEGGRWAIGADLAKIKTWYSNGRKGCGFATGSISHHLELFEFDDGQVYEDFKQDAIKAGIGALIEKIEAGYCERTPGGGVHWFWWCQPALPSTTLAKRPTPEQQKGKALIQTKGEGGYAIVAPSHGAVHPSGRPYVLVSGSVETIPIVTTEQRQELWQLARGFDEMPSREVLNEKRPAGDLDPSLPGNDFCNKASWHDLLEPHGWRAVYSRGGVTYWRRPGKNAGISASTNYGGYDLFYPWTTSTEFEDLRGYSKFSVYGLLEHGGDFEAAARKLGQDGYGAKGVRVIIGKGERPPVSEYVPEMACPLNAEPVKGTWLEAYCDYAARVSPMTPRAFHESAGLWLISTAIARRLCMRMPFATIYPNVWALWLAPTTLYRKSTAMDVAKGIARRAFSHLLTSQEMSAEGFMSDMAGYEPANLEKLTQQQKERWQKGRDYAAQKGLIIDEASGLLAGAGRDYNAGLIEALLRFYDCDEDYTRTTRGQGLVIIRNASLALLGASTPAAMASHLTSDRLWSMGWWPRFGIVTPGDERPDWQEPLKADEPTRLVHELQHLYERLPASQWIQPAGALFVDIDGEALHNWTAFNKWASYDSLTDELDHRLFGTYGRLPTQVIKVSTLLAAMDWPDGDERPYIEAGHLARARLIVDQWRLGAHQALVVATRTEDDVTIARVRRTIAKLGSKGGTMRDLSKLLKDMKPGALLAAVEQLIRLGEVEKESKGREGAGRPTEIIRVVTE